MEMDGEIASLIAERALVSGLLRDFGHVLSPAEGEQAGIIDTDRGKVALINFVTPIGTFYMEIRMVKNQ